LTLEELTFEFAKNQIYLSFMKITDLTDKMIEIMDGVYRKTLQSDGVAI
jgi:hypothetical protein